MTPVSSEGGPDGGTEYVRSLARGLAVIQSFGRERPSMTLSEVAAATGLTRAAARRCLHTLVRLGFVAFDGKRFALMPQVLCLGYAYLSSLPWWQVAQPFMEEVARTVNESCSASVFDKQDVVYVARMPTTRIMAINISIGTRLPAYCTSMGRVLLAHLPPDALDAYFAEAKLVPLTDRTVTDEAELRSILAAVRKEGYALIDQELEAGVRSLAVPIFDRNRTCIAAMNVGVHPSRFSRKQLVDDVLPVLRKASAKVTDALRM